MITLSILGRFWTTPAHLQNRKWYTIARAIYLVIILTPIKTDLFPKSVYIYWIDMILCD